MLNQVRRLPLPDRTRTIDPSQIPNQTTSSGRASASRGTPATTAGPRARLRRHLLRPHAAAALRGPDQQLPHPSRRPVDPAAPARRPGNPNNTVYKQLLLIGIDLNRDAARPAARADAGADHADRHGARPHRRIRSSARSRSRSTTTSRTRAPTRSASAWSARSPRVTVGVDGVYVKTDHLQRNRELNLPAPVRPRRTTRRSARSSA